MNIAKHAAQHKVMLHESANAEFELARTGLKAIFEVVRLCGHQCIPMHGHRDEDVTSNFNCIVNLIAKFNPQVRKYQESDLKQKFLSPQQNEILKDLARSAEKPHCKLMKLQTSTECKKLRYACVSATKTWRAKRCLLDFIRNS